jgi:hypothetical protein
MKNVLKPVHFVRSKWDEGQNTKLKLAKSKSLLEFKNR